MKWRIKMKREKNKTNKIKTKIKKNTPTYWFGKSSDGWHVRKYEKLFLFMHLILIINTWDRELLFYLTDDVFYSMGIHNYMPKRNCIETWDYCLFNWVATRVGDWSLVLTNRYLIWNCNKHHNKLIAKLYQITSKQ